MTDKEMAALQLEIQNLEDQRRKLKDQGDAAGTQYLIGIGGAVVGLVLLVFTTWEWLGSLLIVAGILAVLTQLVKQHSIQRELDAVDEKIQKLRSQAAQSLREQI